MDIVLHIKHLEMLEFEKKKYSLEFDISNK